MATIKALTNIKALEDFREQEKQLLASYKAQNAHSNIEAPKLTLGQRVADKVAATMGSWKFIIFQSTILFLWMALNVTAFVQQWDPYPFILLNLALSFQAAYAAPFIMMSQNRQQEIDRQTAKNDYQIDLKAEHEIKL